MKLIMENWRNFTNEAKKRTAPIETIRGIEQVPVSYELGNFFAYKVTARSKSHYIVTHIPSGHMIPSSYYIQSYGGKLADIKRMLKDIDEKLDLPDLSSPEPSVESLQALADFISGSQELNEIVGKDSADALKDFSDASKQTADDMADVADKQQAALDAQTKTSESFQEFADAIGAFSDSISDSSEESDEMLELYKKFEEANLGEFIDKIGELAPLADMMDKVEDGKGAGELIAGLQELDMDPKEIGEKLTMVQELRDEFDEYKQEQEERQKEKEEEQAEKDAEQDAAMKDASREGTDTQNAAQAEAEG